MTTVLVVLAGVGLLLWLGVLVGTQMDTRTQRRARERLAEERRLLGREQGARPFVVRRCKPDELCSSCPFR